MCSYLLRFSLLMTSGNQLTTKERILRDKEAEFTACTLKFESIIEEQTKSAAKSTQMHEIMTSREAEVDYIYSSTKDSSH